MSLHCCTCGQPLPLTSEEKKAIKSANARLSMQKARERGTKLGRPSTYDHERIKSLLEQGLSYSTIVGIVKCSKSVVQNVKRSIPPRAQAKE